MTRVHQEDACQALGIAHEAHRGRGKYQSAGGPSLRQIATLLSTYGVDPNRELAALAALMMFTVSVGNADAHGKNIALLHDDAGNVSLAPAYDTVPTALWPVLRTNAAMTIGGRVHLDSVTLKDLLAETKSWGMPSETAMSVLTATIEQIRNGKIEHDKLRVLVLANTDRLGHGRNVRTR